MPATTGSRSINRAQASGPDLSGDPQVVLAWVLLDGHRREDFLRFESALAEVEEVQAVLLVDGSYDYLLVLIMRDIDSCQVLQDRLLASNLGIAEYTSTFVLGLTCRTGNLEVPPSIRGLFLQDA